MPNASRMGVPPEIIAQWKEDFRQKKAEQAKSGSKRLPSGSVQYEYDGVVYTAKLSGKGSVAFPQASYEAKVEGARSRKGEQQKIKLSSIEQQLVDQKYEDARMLSKHLGQKVVVDHIIPIDKGGFANDPNNLQLITEGTNLRKSSSMEWYNASQDESKYLSNLANELAGDINYSKGTATLRRSAIGLAGAGLAALGPLGTAASAAETTQRTEIAQQTGDIVDKAQAAISGVSLAADVAAYNPLTAIPCALVSTGADLLNLAIDGGRAMIKGTATYDRKQLERQEKLRGLPADAPERQGFASEGGM